MNSQASQGYTNSKAVIYAIHFFIILTFCLFDNELRIGIKNKEFFSTIKFIIFLVLEIYYYETCSGDPGYLSLKDNDQSYI